jgi:sugar-phosphatase
VIDAVVFDMDGVVVDSEPLWVAAEIEVFGAVGVALTVERCRETTGLRIDEAVDHWWQRHPWSGPTPAEVADAIVERVVALVRERSEPMPGVREAVAAARALGPVALASSSSRRLIDAVLDRLGLDFDVVHSAEDEAFGKPHPAIYLTTCERLGTAPFRTLAVEDSVNGVVAAKAARLACVAVPEPAQRGDRRFGIADAELDSLEALAPWLAARQGS